ncbi:MAG: outer membrane protein beta-barrel domain [Acidobacteriota bacterium]|jgi:opacity protein-like surface antigen|nr:outer membrane protein beta-barrel domain [Acidobacteriota bacterium]
MMKKLTFAALLLASALPLAAQNWSFGASAGPFVFGDFYERRLRPGTEQGPAGQQTLTLSAATRAGLALDLERSLGDRWAIRAEGTLTRAPLTIRQKGDSDGVELDAGEMDVSTFMLPVVFRLNPRGTFRFHALAGPALAVYRLEGRDNASGAEPAFEGTQLEWGFAFGGGVAWWVSDRFAIEGNLTDTITTSPFDEESFPSAGSLEISRPHNVHTTIGVRWRF